MCSIGKLSYFALSTDHSMNANIEILNSLIDYHNRKINTFNCAKDNIKFHYRILKKINKLCQ